jgi:ferredoxin
LAKDEKKQPVNLERLAGQLARDDSRPVSLVGEHCLNYHDKARTCQACSASCPAGAIAPGKPQRLDSSRVARCQRCRAPFPAATGGDYCPVCEHRRPNLVTVVIPPAEERPAGTSLCNALPRESDPHQVI